MIPVHRNMSRAFAFWRLKDPVRSVTICSTNLHVRHRIGGVVRIQLVDMQGIAKRQLFKGLRDAEESK
jgi:hypothetical protein